MERQLHWVYYAQPIETDPHVFITQERCNCPIGVSHHDDDYDKPTS